jgi:hypothetical protein
VTVHRGAHGLLADDIIEVEEGTKSDKAASKVGTTTT